MATLVTRPGDPQALKAAAAAAAADTQLAVLPLAEAGAWKKLLADAADPAAARQLLLVTPDGGALAEPNAIARYLGAWPLRACTAAAVARSAAARPASAEAGARSSRESGGVRSAGVQGAACTRPLHPPSYPTHSLQVAACRRSLTWEWSRGSSGRSAACAPLCTLATARAWPPLCAASATAWRAGAAS